MGQFLTDGRLVDVILGLVILEALGLALWCRWGDARVSLAALLANLGAGGFLLLALRIALGQGWWGWMALSLLAALFAHLGDLAGRLRRSGSGLASGQASSTPARHAP